MREGDPLVWLEHSVDIEAPVESVFDFWKDPANQIALAPDDRAELVDLKITDSGVGTSYRVAMEVAGRTVTGLSMEFTEVIPNRLTGRRWACTGRGATSSPPRATAHG